MGPTWDPSGSCRPQIGPILAPWTLLSGSTLPCPIHSSSALQCVQSRNKSGSADVWFFGDSRVRNLCIQFVNSIFENLPQYSKIYISNAHFSLSYSRSGINMVSHIWPDPLLNKNVCNSLSESSYNKKNWTYKDKFFGVLASILHCGSLGMR